jgi:cytochrome P450
MQAALDGAVAYASARRMFGQRELDFPLVRAKLGAMAVALEASRRLAYRAARLFDDGATDAATYASLAKLYASRATERVTRDAVQLHGAMGYAEETEVSRLFVDARVLPIFEGAEDVLSLRVVGRAIFGEDVERAVPVIRRTFPVLTRYAIKRVLSPINPPASWPTPASVRADRARGALYALADDLIVRRRRAGIDGDDLLSRLLAARDADTGEAMDTQQIRDEALVFLLAGHETTSTALTFALQLLGRHLDEQERAANEVADVLGDRPPRIEDLPALDRTRMVLKEALRLYPPAYAFSRLAERDDEIGGYRIPAGSFVVVSQWATHRHPGIWADPGEFRPERFTAEREAERHRYAYFPFGGGPRACIGSHFAMQEAQIALATILQRYRIRARLASVPLDTTGITLRPQTAVPIEVTPLRRSSRG